MVDPYQRDRRLGRWTVHYDTSADAAGMLLLQRDVVVRDVRHRPEMAWIEYIGQSEHFEIVPLGDEVPFYVPIVHVENNEPQSVTWARAAPLSALRI